MNTIEQWTRGEYDGERAAAGVAYDKRGDRWTVGHSPTRGFIAAWIDFEPSVVEARAVLRMPEAGDGTSVPRGSALDAPITRQSVHAFIREHGSVEDCEVITPWLAPKQTASQTVKLIACPGCGEWAEAGAEWHKAAHNHNGHGARPWHAACRVRVQNPEQDFAPRDLVIANATGRMAVVTEVHEDGRMRVHLDGDDEPGDLWRSPGCFTLLERAASPTPTQPEDYEHDGATLTNPIGLPIAPRPIEEVLGVPVRKETSKPPPEGPHDGDLVEFEVVTRVDGSKTTTALPRGIVVPYPKGMVRGGDGYLCIRRPREVVDGKRVDTYTVVAIERCKVVQRAEDR